MSDISDIAYGSQNLVFVEMMYDQFLQDPNSVDQVWVDYFHTMQHEGPAPVLVTDDQEQTGTYDSHIAADPHPIIHKAAVRPRNAGISPKVHAFLSKVPMFQSISDEDLHMVEGITRELDLKPGQYLCREGQTKNDLFFIVSGTVSIIREGNEITWLSAGEMVGELAVFDTRPRSADIVTKTDCQLLRISRDDLQSLLETNSGLSLKLLKQLSIRLRDAGFRQERVDHLVRAYRERGHVMAKLDPLGRIAGEHPELTLEHYGFKEEDLNLKFSAQIGRETSGRSLKDIVGTLQKIYCQAIGAQYMHIDDLEIQEWLRIRLEEKAANISLGKEEQIRILKKLTDAEVLENFLHKKFVGAKRFSLEGSESLIPLLDYAIEEAGKHELDEVIIGMAHRGRLNVLINVMEKPASQVFREFQDKDPNLHMGRGDVKYHLGYGCNRNTPTGHKVHLSLCFNPSHLEFVGPVAYGRARAKQDRFGDVNRERALPMIIHGDAAFAGQGVIQEVFNLSELPGYSTGGAVHVVLNNQIGFTTNPEDSRSSQYSTDVARMLQIPIFHVNGEHPEAVALVIRIAMDFRKRFKKDVVIDMYGYRKYGHNEGDDPSFTQPLMYQAIKKRKTVRQAYVENLLKLGGLTKEEADQIAEDSRERLDRELEKTKDPDYQYEHISAGTGLWSAYKGGRDRDVPNVDTGLPKETLSKLLKRISTYPDDFTPHKKIKRFLEDQAAMADGQKELNWGAGEALAFASILAEGYSVRITGQDAERGTFSHRHAVLHDHLTDKPYTPLQHVADDQGAMEIYNSPLSETAVLGFEYGYSLDTPDGLLIWEAQFGDFCNVAQVIIDQFISSGEEKWRRLSGICLFLPHGFEGQGPEHSSARLERFLMLSAMDNMQVVNLTTPAQLYHCLRRQVKRPIRKPLVVMSPKSLLRHPAAVSTMDEMAGGEFQKIIPDMSDLKPEDTKRVLLCSGKVYYELEAKRREENIQGVAIMRMEQYYPLPDLELAEALKPYPEGLPVVWVQEEPMNMGAWSFLRLHFRDQLKGNGNHPMHPVTRREAASPATGSAASHKIEQERLLNRAFDLSTDTP